MNTTNSPKRVSLGVLAQELGFNKSKLAYYVSLGLLKPAEVIGKMMIFERWPALKAIDFITTKQKEGKTLNEIKKLLK